MIIHNKPSCSHLESDAARNVIESGFLAQGKEVQTFENEFCNYMGLSEGHAVAVSSGTAALYMSLIELGAKNKKVGLPVYTCSTLRHATNMCGAIPKFFDTYSDNCNINLETISENNCEIAIIPHMFGFPQEINTNSKLKIIEDCAQSLGSTINGEKVGLQGDIGIFSFYATKLMTSGGQGGMIVSKDKSLIDSIRDYRQFDCRKDKKNRFNFQMTDLQAAIGRVQLQKLDHFLEKRQQIFQWYKKAGLNIFDPHSDECQPVRFRTLLISANQKKIIQKLKEQNILAIVPIEKWELLDHNEVYPNATKWCSQLVSLPCYPDLNQNNIKKVLEALEEYTYHD